MPWARKSGGILIQTLPRFDPYGDGRDLPEEFQQVGRDYFARSPGSNLWIWFHDLPDATADRLLEKHEHKLAFPAGLPGAK